MDASATVPARMLNLPDFMTELENRKNLKRISTPVSLKYEITEIHRRVLLDGGPALLFEKPVFENGKVSPIPVLANLFGTEERIAWGLGVSLDGLEKLGEDLAALRSPDPVQSLGEVWQKLPMAQAFLTMRPKNIRRASCQERVFKGEDVDLSMLPIQWCWPEEPAPLITWGLVMTTAPDDPNDVNVGVYRMQVLGKDRLIMRWLAHRGGAKHHHAWQKLGRDMPVAVIIGADPATILSAVMPLPENISELSFSGLLRKARTPLVRALTVPLSVPAHAEIVIEGTVSTAETAEEGPYGDHTGYYNSVDLFPVMQVSAITMRNKPIYLSTYTGRPPDEPSRLGEALNRIFVPLVKKQFPEITDIWLPPEACSYRAMIVAIDKRYPGQAKRVMLGLWGMLPQFNYTKLMIAVDSDINVRNWDDVVWALSTRFDASRDVTILDNMPIDYLDFSSPKSGLGGKMALDATNKMPPETDREWGKVLSMSQDVQKRVDDLWPLLGLSK